MVVDSNNCLRIRIQSFEVLSPTTVKNKAQDRIELYFLIRNCQVGPSLILHASIFLIDLSTIVRLLPS